MLTDLSCLVGHGRATCTIAHRQSEFADFLPGTKGIWNSLAVFNRLWDAAVALYARQSLWTNLVYVRQPWITHGAKTNLWGHLMRQKHQKYEYALVGDCMDR